jgi:hypothetical protein
MTLDSRINNMHWNYWFWLLCITLSSKFVKQNAEKDYNIYSVSKLVQTTYICSLLHSDCLSDPFWFVRKSIFWELCYFHQKSLLTWLRSTNRDKDLFFSTNNLKIDETGEEGLISWSRTKLLMAKNEFSGLRFFRTLDSMYMSTYIVYQFGLICIHTRKILTRSILCTITVIGYYHGCQIFLGTKYQNGKKYFKLPRTIPNVHKI